MTASVLRCWLVAEREYTGYSPMKGTRKQALLGAQRENQSHSQKTKPGEPLAVMGPEGHASSFYLSCAALMAAHRQLLCSLQQRPPGDDMHLTFIIALHHSSTAILGEVHPQAIESSADVWVLWPGATIDDAEDAMLIAVA